MPDNPPHQKVMPAESVHIERESASFGIFKANAVGSIHPISESRCATTSALLVIHIFDLKQAMEIQRRAVLECHAAIADIDALAKLCVLRWVGAVGDADRRMKGTSFMPTSLVGFRRE